MMKSWKIKYPNHLIAGINIDGVLNLYPKSWIEFINKILNANFENLNVVKQVIDYQTYKKLKTIWRTSDEKINQPIREGACEFLSSLTDHNFQIILTSKRPVDDIPELRTLTISWLKSHKLFYDDIIFSKKKHLMLVDQFPNLSFMIEDHGEIANQVAQFGFKVFLMDNSYNRDNIKPGVIRVKKLSEILETLADGSDA